MPATNVRLQRELECLGIDPDIVKVAHPMHAFIKPAWSAVNAFQHPVSPEALAVSQVPGRARVVASIVANVFLQAQARATTELCNVDRTADELLQKPLGPVLPLTVILDGLLPHDVGCLLRTCETARVQLVLLCGNTPGPLEPAVLKTSLGAEEHVAYRHADDLDTELQRLRKEGTTVWALTTCGLHYVNSNIDSLDFYDATALELPSPLALVVTTHGHISSETAAVGCDLLVCLQSPGPSSNSNLLGSAVVGSVAIYEILQRWQNLYDSESFKKRSFMYLRRFTCDPPLHLAKVIH